ncbi:MAG: stage II sporulation protein M [Bryobacteraceae bacterium]
MILDLPRFVAAEQAYWQELETILDRIESDPLDRMTLDQMERFHYLYERSSADLARMATFSAEAEAREHLESLVARAYGEIHSTRERRKRPRPLHWFFTTFPATVRRHARLFWIAVAITLLGCAFGSLAVWRDPDSKAIIMPFQGLEGNPAERVAKEEKGASDRLRNHRATFSAQLMTHNIRVSIATFTLGITWGAGTAAVLFYNGVTLGAVSADYVRAGQTEFLLGWLLPHGVIEIPAFLIAGQAGLLLASALIGWGRRTTRRERLRAIGGDLVTLAGGVAVLLVWAGLVEAFLSQYHRPVVPYGLKIGFGVAELILLALFLGRSGFGATLPAAPNRARQQAEPR